MIEVHKPQMAMSTHLVGMVNATTPVPWSSSLRRLAISESPAKEKFNVFASGKKMAVSNRRIATVDTTVICVLVETAPLMNELRNRPHIISNQ